MCSRLLLGALLPGVSFDPESRLLFGLLDHSSFTFSCRFSCKLKKNTIRNLLLSAAPHPPPDHNVQRETSRCKQTRDLQQRQSRRRGNREAKLFVAFLFQTSPRRLPRLLAWACSVTVDSANLAGRTASFVIGQEMGPLFKANRERLHRSGSVRLPCVYVNNCKTCDVRAANSLSSVLPPLPRLIAFWLIPQNILSVFLFTVIKVCRKEKTQGRFKRLLDRRDPTKSGGMSPRR